MSVRGGSGRPAGHPGWFLLPALIAVGVLYVLPALASVALAFTDWNTFRSDLRFVGLRNFFSLGPAELIEPLWLTIRFAFVAVLAQTVLALSLALALERSGRLRGALRAILFLPVLVSPMAAAFVWQAILAPRGLLNGALDTVGAPLGLPAIEVAWLGAQDFTIYVLALVQAWKWFGISMLVFIAGLKAVPPDVVEAARVAGASGWQVFRFVKLPLLGPAMTFNVVLGATTALAAYDLVLGMTKGGPGNSTAVFNIRIVRYLADGNLALGSALTLILVLVVALAAVPLLTQLRRSEVQL